ncbi:energy-coupling factor ABC transporter permease [Streptomyces litchfieldiae]|uniref:Energy-coupling factor ABC transporter permease n=1 Tax=Streptomyces litchfieldiae TaxID=3075543 RepID=A0ABU2N2P6_9ACTN|nr:energy-coupling factor ABC transporter permease [Streptomyces sp. DSM 44938]MDT0347004.1 energy-coupling factor ABC transporter permease [Streptomyces sp. DSM 44938]
MHVPDGFLDAPVSLATGAVAAGTVAVCLRGARRELGERAAPLAGLVAAFVFAVQMLNFPVGAGTSGHLLGGALATILVGPCTGILCLAVVLLMQALLFADGGLTALGTNITLMGLVTVVVAQAVFAGLLRVLPRGRGAVGAASFAAALVSVPASAIAFTGLYAIGGTADVSLGRVLAAMTGVHVLIGLGEAVITTATVGAVLAVRPDLVRGAAGMLRPALVIRTADGSVPAPAPEPAPAAPGRSARPVWLAGAAVTLVCAAFVSFYASADPDGLERVATDEGIAEEAREHGLADSPLADYGVRDVDNERLSVGLAGAAGVAVTLAAGSGVFLAVRRVTGRAADPAREREPERV